MFSHVIEHGYLFAGLGLLTGSAFVGIRFFQHHETVPERCFLVGMLLLILSALLGVVLNPIGAVVPVYLSAAGTAGGIGLLVFELLDALDGKLVHRRHKPHLD